MSPRLRAHGFALVLFLLAPLAVAQADPTVSHLDPLIAELQALSGALEGATEKDEKKQKKIVDKLLNIFGKDSKGPDQDLKNAGKAAKVLAKVFPEEVPDPDLLVAAAIAEGTLAELILQALELFAGDLDALLDQAQDLIDTLPTGCEAKAQAVLDKVVDIVDEAGDPTPGDLAGYAKALARR